MSLPKKLLADFDEVLKDRGYQSRSKGIRDALQDYIVRYQWMNAMEGERIGIVTHEISMDKYRKLYQEVI